VPKLTAERIVAVSSFCAALRCQENYPDAASHTLFLRLPLLDLAVVAATSCHGPCHAVQVIHVLLQHIVSRDVLDVNVNSVQGIARGVVSDMVQAQVFVMIIGVPELKDRIRDQERQLILSPHGIVQNQDGKERSHELNDEIERMKKQIGRVGGFGATMVKDVEFHPRRIRVQEPVSGDKGQLGTTQGDHRASEDHRPVHR
jgi:hypothetical protein